MALLFHLSLALSPFGVRQNISFMPYRIFFSYLPLTSFQHLTDSCDLQCEREWFHLECVGLTEVPGRTAKWYCPDCRKKLAKGLAGPDGIVRAGGRR